MQNLADGSGGRYHWRTGWLKIGLWLALAGLLVATGRAQPVNDLFANATVLTNYSGTVSGSNLGATLENCEPAYITTDDFASVVASVWYAWTPIFSGPAEFDTFGSSFDTVLAVYTTPTGLCDPALTLVTANDDSTNAPTSNPFASQVYFTAVAGTTYYIAVDGNLYPFAGIGSGNYVLNWSSTNSGVAALAAIPSGDFLFTSPVYTNSEDDSEARITVTRTNGFNGRVLVNYTVGQLTFTNTFYTNTLSTNFWTISFTNVVATTDTNLVTAAFTNQVTATATNALSATYTNDVLDLVTNLYAGSIYSNNTSIYYTNNYGYYDAGYQILVVGNVLTSTVSLFSPTALVPTITNVVVQNISTSGVYPAHTPPFNLTGTTLSFTVISNLTDGLTFTNTFMTNAFQLPSVLINLAGFNYTNTFTTNTFGTNTVVTDSNTNGIYTTTYSLTTVAYSNYFSLIGVLLDGSTTTYTVVSSNLVFLQPYSNSNAVLAAVTNSVAGPVVITNGVTISPAGTTNYFTNTITTTYYTYSITNTITYYYTDSYNLTTRATNVVASAPISYTNNSGTLVFSNYQTSVDLEIPIHANLLTQNGVGDLAGLASLTINSVALDPAESVALAPPTIDPIGGASVLNILNPAFAASTAVPILNFEVSHTQTGKDSPPVTITVYRSGGDTADSVSVDYAIEAQVGPPKNNTFALSAGSDYATPNSDFTLVSGTLVWGQNDTQPKSFSVASLNNGLVEPNVDFRVNLSNPLDLTTPTVTPLLGALDWTYVTILFDGTDGEQQPAGALDRTWNKDNVYYSSPPFNEFPGTSGGNGGQVYAVATQPDGNTIIAGSFVSFNGNPCNRIGRMLSSGYQDATFLAPPNSGANDYIAAMALQPDGRVVIGGNFTSFNGVSRHHIARLNPDGSVDTTFNPGLGADAIVWSLCVETNTGQIVMGGEFTSYNGTNVNGVARLNPDGSLDTSFAAVSNDGMIDAVAVDAYGRVLIGGTFNNVNGVNSGGVARLNVDGSLDTSFGVGVGTYDDNTGTADQVDAIAVQPDGRILIGGALTAYALTPYNGILRLNTDGTADTSFAPGTGTYNPYTGLADTIYAITLQPDGNILIGGDFQWFNQTRRVGLARLLSFGSLDTSFLDPAYNEFAGIPNQYFNENAVNAALYPVTNKRNLVHAIGLEPSGNVIIGGSFFSVGGGYTRNEMHNRSNIARLIGGSTPGPGNIEFTYPSYSADKSQVAKFVTLIRTNGNLANAWVTFGTNTPYLGAGVATPNDFGLPVNDTQPTWPTIWSLNTAASYPIFPGVSGDNNDTTPVLNGHAYVSITLSNNLSRHGNLDFDMTVANPKGEVTLGGQVILVGAALGPQTLSPFTIIDTGTLPGTLGFSSPSYFVSESGTNAYITVTRTGGSDGIVQVSYNTTNGTATTANYTPVSGTLTFLGGVTSQTITIPIINGTSLLPDKTVNLGLYNAAGGAQLGLSTAVLTIVNRNYTPGQINFSQTAYGTNENSRMAYFTVERLGGSSGTLQVTNTVTPGTAVNGVNFIGSTNVLFWNSGDVSSRTIGVPIFDDGVVTSNLTVNLGLFGSVVNTKLNLTALGLYTNATLTLSNVDEYGTVQFSAASYSVKKYAGYALVPVERVGGLAQTVTVGYQTLDGTAVNGANYVTNSGTLTFTNGQVYQSISVPIIDDGLADGLRSFSLLLTNATPTTSLGTPHVATVNIIDTYSVNETPGTPDVTFYSAAGCNSNVYTLALQPNNQLLIGGDFTMADGVTREHIARLNVDGTLDPSFLLPYDTSGANNTVRAMTVMADGRIAIGGNFTTFNQVAMNYLAILNVDGSLDSTFNPGSGADNPVYAVAETFANGQSEILVGGAFANLNGAPYNGIGLLNVDGNPDPGFNPGLGANATVYALAVQSDGKVIIGGDFTAVNGATNFNHIGRLNVDGSVDQNFNPAGSGAGASVRAITLQPDGKILIGGLFTNVNGVLLPHLARLNTDGTVDTGFQPGVGANDTVYSIGVQTDARIVVGGAFTSFSGVTRNRVTRLNPNGSVDPTINFGFGANNFVASVVVEEDVIAGYPTNVPDEKIILGGGFTSYDGQPFNHLVRIYGGSISGSGAFQFTSANYQIDENATNVVVTVVRTGGTSGTNTADFSGDIYVPFATVSDGSAVAGINYGAIVTNLDFPEGEVLVNITIPVYDDGVVTSNLTVGLDLSQPFPAGDLGNQPTAVLTILNDDSDISFSATTYQVPKNVISGVAAINVLRQGATYGTSTVLFSTTTNGTAIPGTDYTPVYELLTFSPGVSNIMVPVSINNNGIPEVNQTVGLQLTEVTGSYPVSPTNAVLTIINTVNAPGQLAFSATNYNVTEGGGVGYSTVVVTVVRTNGSSGIVSVHFSTLDGTAGSGIKYVATNGFLTFGDGQSSQSFNVEVVNTTTAEGTEYFGVALTNATGGASFATPTNATITILNTNTGIAFASTSTTFVEPTNTVPRTVSVNVVRLNSTNGVTTVNYSTQNGTAVAGTNFVGITNAVLTFEPGISETNILITTLQDPRPDRSLDLEFTVVLSNPSAGAQLTAPTTTTLIDQDSRAGLFFYTSANLAYQNAWLNYLENLYEIYIAEGLLTPTQLLNDLLQVQITDTVYENAGSVQLVVVCANTNAEPVWVNYATSDGTAVAGRDYIATNGTLAFTNGTMFNFITVRIIPNSLVQSNKQFSVNLLNPTPPGVLLYPSNAVVTILSSQTPYGLSFSSPQDISGSSGSVTVDNTTSVPETGDPTIAGNPPTAPVWFRWTAPADGEVTLDTIGSLATNGMKLDTVLGVYTGSSLSTLNQVAANDDLYTTIPFLSTYGQYNYDDQTIYNPALRVALATASSGTNTTTTTEQQDQLTEVNDGNTTYYQPYGGPSGLRFNARAGVTYYIAADTKIYTYYFANTPLPELTDAADLTGPITLNWAYHSSGVFRFATERIDLTGLTGTNGIPPLLYECAETEGESGHGFSGTENNIEYRTTQDSYYDPDVLGLLVTVTRVAGSSGRVWVDYTTADVNPAVLTNGDIPAVSTADLTTVEEQGTNLIVSTTEDYSPVSGTLVFDDFEMSKTIFIPIYEAGLAEPNRDFNVVLSNPRLDPNETGDVSAPRVDPVFGTALCRILSAYTDPAESGAIQVVTSNTVAGATNVTYMTNLVSSYTATNPVFNFGKSNYRVPRDIQQWAGGTAVTIYVNRTGTNTSAVTLHYRMDNYFLDSIASDDENNQFPLQPGSDYAVPTPATTGQIDGTNSDFAGVGGDTGTLTFPANKTDSQPIHFTVKNNKLPEFNKDIRITLFAEDAKGNPYQVGMINDCTVTILFDDNSPPAGSVDEFYNQDFAADYVSATAVANNGSTVANPGTELYSEVYSVAVLPNNGVTTGNQSLIAGAFSTYEDANNTYTVNGIARLNYDGTLDTSFNPGSGVNVFPGGQFIRTAQMTAANQILIGGYFDTYNGVQRNNLARLNADGSLDTTFNPGSGANGTVWAMAQQADGRILIGGDFTTYNNIPAAHVARINLDGTLDTSFNALTNLNGAVYAIAVEGDNNAVVLGGNFTSFGGPGGQNYIVRLNPDGSQDTTFNTITGPNAAVRTVAFEPNDEVLAGGDFTLVAGQRENHIVRFNLNGAVDTSFNSGTGTDGTVYDISYNSFTTTNTTILTNATTSIVTTNTTMTTNDTLYVGGAFTSFNGTRRAGFARLYLDGSVDTTFLDTAYNQFAGLHRVFYGDPPGTVYASGVQDDGNIMIVGSFQSVGGGQADKNSLNTLDYERGLVESFDDPYLWVSGGESEIERHSRDGVRIHSNVARLIGGATPGPGNIGMVAPSYAVNKTQPSEPISLVRTNGTLGYASANFAVVPGLAQSGRDYAYSGQAPIYPIQWEYLPTESRMHGDGLFGGTGLMEDPYGGFWKMGTTGPASVNIGIMDDSAVAGNLDATLQMANPAGADQFYLGGENIPVGVALGESVAPLTLVDNSHQDGVFGFAANSYTATSSLVNVGLVRTNSSIGTVEVFYETLTNGTAILGTDYRPTNGVVTFNPSQTVGSFPVQILENSYISGTEKTVALKLYNIQDLSSGDASLGLANAVIRIINPNYQGYLSFSAPTYSANLSAGSIAFTVQRTVGSKGTLTVEYATTNGTAVSGTDYVGAEKLR